MATDPLKQAEADAKKADKEYTIGGNVYTVDQETTNQLVLDEAAAAQTRINMKLAADEDKKLKTYFPMLSYLYHTKCCHKSKNLTELVQLLLMHTSGLNLVNI